LSKQENEKWIEDFVDRVTAVARKHVQDAETAVMKEQEDMRDAVKAGSTTRKPEKSFEEMLYAMGDCLSDLSSSDDKEDGEHDRDDAENT